MEMSPQRVRSAEFKTVRKGADPKEVKAFLDDVADELERAQNQSTAMEARARAAVARLQEVTESGAAAAPAARPGRGIRRRIRDDQPHTAARAAHRRHHGRPRRAARRRASSVPPTTRRPPRSTRPARWRRKLLDEARAEARRAGETERIAIAGEVEALKARRDFLESDVEQLELFLTEQRNRLREAATSIVDIVERVPGGLGAARPPLLSASDDEPGDDDLEVGSARDVGRRRPATVTSARRADDGDDLAASRRVRRRPLVDRRRRTHVADASPTSLRGGRVRRRTHAGDARRGRRTHRAGVGTRRGRLPVLVRRRSQLSSAGSSVASWRGLPRRRPPAELPPTRGGHPRAVGEGRHVPGLDRSARGRRARLERVRVLRRSAVRQRAAALRPPADRVRQGRDPALPDHARPTGRAALRLGLPRPARRGGGREGARDLRPRPRSPRSGIDKFNEACRTQRAAVTPTTGSGTSPARPAGSTSTTTTRPWTSPTWRASCGRSRRCGTRV